MLETSRKRAKLLRVFCALAALLVLVFRVGPTAHADTTYQYTGQGFTTFDGSDSCVSGVGECQLTGTLTLATALPPSTSETFDNPVGYSFTDGSNKLTQANSGGLFELTTNGSGAIDAWFIEIFSASLCGGKDCTVFGSEANESGFPVNGDGSESNSGGVESNAYSDGAGAWGPASSSMPEPSLLLILSCGLFGIVAMRRKVSA